MDTKLAVVTNATDAEKAQAFPIYDDQTPKGPRLSGVDEWRLPSQLIACNLPTN